MFENNYETEFIGMLYFLNLLSFNTVLLLSSNNYHRMFRASQLLVYKSNNIWNDF